MLCFWVNFIGYKKYNDKTKIKWRKEVKSEEARETAKKHKWIQLRQQLQCLLTHHDDAKTEATSLSVSLGVSFSFYLVCFPAL